MVEAVAKNIYRIGVLLPGNPLKELNSYFIRGEERDLLIDTGFRCEACQKALEDGLRELESDPEKRDVLATHVHSDHSGMADLFIGRGRKAYMGQIDLNYQKATLYGKERKHGGSSIYRRALQQRKSNTFWRAIRLSPWLCRMWTTGLLA